MHEGSLGSLRRQLAESRAIEREGREQLQAEHALALEAAQAHQELLATEAENALAEVDALVAKADALAESLSERDSALSHALAIKGALETRLQQLRAELDAARCAAARAHEELERVSTTAEVDLHASALQIATSARTVSGLQGELGARDEENGVLRDRCSSLQASLHVLTDEVKAQRERARASHEEAVQARCSQRSDADRSAAQFRGLQSLLGALKTDFFSFVESHHGVEAANVARAISTSAGAARTIALHASSPSRSSLDLQSVLASTTPARAAATAIVREMDELQQRLDSRSAGRSSTGPGHAHGP